MQNTPRPLVVVSSRTGNTRILAHALTDAFDNALLVDADRLPDDLSAFNPVFLGFWCDRGMAPEDMKEAVKKLSGKTIGCFATMGGDPTAEKALEWMQKTCDALVQAGEGNTLKTTFLARGRVEQKLFEQMTQMYFNGVLTPEREARHREGQRHPDRCDVEAVVTHFKAHF